MQQCEWIHGAWLGLAIMLENADNVLLKFSAGFRRKRYAIFWRPAVLPPFSALSDAHNGLDLTTPYAQRAVYVIAPTPAAR